jgi:hypothetical protein
MAFPAETFENLSLVPATRHSESKLEDHERNNPNPSRFGSALLNRLAVPRQYQVRSGTPLPRE